MIDKDYELNEWDKRELGADPKFAVASEVPESFKNLVNSKRQELKDHKSKVEDVIDQDLLDATGEVK